MSPQLIVGCYTPGDYAREAEERILPSIRALGLAHDIREVRNRGSWIQNGFGCQIFLRQMHDEMPDTDFLFVDADAIIHSNPWPFLQALKCHVAGHYFRGRELLTGTLYLPAGPRRRELLDLWIAKNKGEPDVWDQIHLQRILVSDPTFKVVDLPPEYCCIFDTQRRLKKGIVPVIEHFQASRRLKKQVKPEPTQLGCGQGEKKDGVRYSGPGDSPAGTGVVGSSGAEKALSDPLISILAPAYRCVKYIGQMIKSIQAQTYTNWELIIVNDGSKDGLESVARGYADEDKRIHVHRIPHGGHSVALNKSFSLAKGELIGRNDADDWSEPSRLRTQIDELLKQEADLVSCLMVRVRPNGKRTRGRDVGGSGCVPEEFCSNKGGKGPAAATIICRREVWEKVGGFDTSAAGHEWGSTDSDWIFRVLLVDDPPYKWAHVHDELYCYRHHRDQVTKVHGEILKDDHELFRQKYCPRILERLRREKRQEGLILVQGTSEEWYKRVMDSLVEGCERAGYKVQQWFHRRELRSGCGAKFLIWWGCNVDANLERIAKTTGAKCIYLEQGWLLDRHTCFQLDALGIGGRASWAEEPLSYVSTKPIPLKSSGDLLVILRYERPHKLTDNVSFLSPFFMNNMKWLKCLMHSQMPVRLRPHAETKPILNHPLQKFAYSMGWAWDESETFGEAIKTAKAIAVIDSTAGAQALELGIPVLCYGRQVYRHPGVVYCLDNHPVETRRVTEELEGGLCRIDQGAVDAMIMKIRSKQWYPKDVSQFAKRLIQEFGL